MKRCREKRKMSNKEKYHLIKLASPQDYLWSMGVHGAVGGGIGAILHMVRQAIRHKKKYQNFESANAWTEDTLGTSLIPKFKPDWGATAPWAAKGGGMGLAAGALDAYMEDRTDEKEREKREEERAYYA